MTRDNGKTWKNVTPKDLRRARASRPSRTRRTSEGPRLHRRVSLHARARPQALHLPHRRLRRDLDAADRRQERHSRATTRRASCARIRSSAGLLYAGTEFGIFVSFNAGKNWQPLQQNLPVTPVTDIRVHRNDLVISTMGRSAWIMDNITPLQQLAAAAGRLTVLTPSTRVRYRRAGGGRGAGPQYPPVALAFDYVVPDGFSGPLTLTVTDERGRLVRAIDTTAAGRGRGRGTGAPDAGPLDPDAPAAGRGRGGTVPLTVRPGHNRYLWDYRWANNGPLAAPGKYRVELRAGTAADATAASQAAAGFEIQVDPGVLEDGVTVADLVDQQNFLLQVRDAVTSANQLRTSTLQAMEKADIQPAKSPGPGEWAAGMTYAHPLQRIWARLVTAPGIYEQGMLIDQLGNIARAEGGADQKVGAESRKRLEDLVAELKSIEQELAKVDR